MAGRQPGIVIQITADPTTTTAALAQIREQMAATAERAKGSGSEIERAFEKIGHAIEWIGLYEGLRKIGDEMKELVVGSLELGESLSQAAVKTGLSVEALSVLHYAAAELGTDFDSLVSGIARMGKNVTEAATGNKGLAADFKAMGLNAKELSKQTDGSEVAFHKFIDTLAATPNEFARNRLAMDMTGRAGVEQVAMLIDVSRHWTEYEERARSAGVYLDSAGAAALAETNQKLNDLKQSVTGAGLAFTEGLTHGLDDMMDTVRDGRSDREAFTEWGRDMATTMEALAGAIYAVGMALTEAGAGAAFLSGDFASGKKLDALSAHLEHQSARFIDLSMGVHDEQKPANPLDRFTHAPDLKIPAAPFVPPPAEGKKGHVRSDDGYGRAAAMLAEQEALTAAAAQRGADDTALAQLEAKHRLMLVSDQEFYAQKLKLQTDGLNAEESALQKKLEELAALQAKQHNDKTLKRDKGGNSAEEQHTLAEAQKVMAQMDALDARRRSLAATSGADSQLSANASQLANLRIAAELEKEQNAGLEKQIELIRAEHALEGQKLSAKTGNAADAANEKALGEIAVKKLQIEDITKKITASEEQNRLAVEALNDAAAKDPRLKNKAEQQINALNREEAAALKNLVAQYTALANELGGDFLVKAKALQAELDKMNRPSEKGPSKLGKELGSSMSEMVQHIADEAVRGKQSFHDMAMSIEKDLLDLAIKMAAQKWLTPFLQGMMGGGKGGGGSSDMLGWDATNFTDSLPGFADGGSPDGLSIVGEKGPELWVPPAKGGTVLPNSLSTQLAKGGGAGAPPSVQFNLVNNSSQPVTAQPPQVSFDSESKSFIIHTILEDYAQGGMTRAMGGGGAG